LAQALRHSQPARGCKDGRRPEHRRLHGHQALDDAAMEAAPSVAAAAAAGSPAAAPVEDGCASLGETSASGSSGTASWDRDAECWICREDGRNEKLIRPCLCHGSMSGVHRSCVEAWVASQLESGGAGAAAPRCPVCRQEYRGDTAQPGVVAFGRSFCKDVLRQLLRCVLLIAVLSGYWAAAQEGEDWSWIQLWMRVPMLVCTSAFFSYKLLVLLFSLPMLDGPPTGWRRRFTVTTPTDLGGLLGESLASVAIVSLWFLCGMMAFRYTVPILVYAALLSGKLVVVYADYTYLVELAQSSSGVLVQALRSAKDAASHPCAALSPADAGIHVLAATAALAIVLLCRAEAPLVIFLVVHCIVLVACLIENVFIRRLRWKVGKRWMLLVQMGVFVTYSANLLGEIVPELVVMPASWRSFVCSAVWLSLISVLALAVNRAIFFEYYLSWQQLHRKFRLGRSPKRLHRQKATRQPQPPNCDSGLAGGADGRLHRQKATRQPQPPNCDSGLAGGADGSTSAAVREDGAAQATAAEATGSEEDPDVTFCL